MDRNRYVLAVMSGAPAGAHFSPAQLQKLFFLMDREAARYTGGPYYDFTPYDYGPFDAQVYADAESLVNDGLSMVDRSGMYREYALTPEGYAQGIAALTEIAPPGREYLGRAASWVRSVSFHQLITAIYERYPEMKENSVFHG